MTKDDIILGLTCCLQQIQNCGGCPFEDVDKRCISHLLEAVLATFVVDDNRSPCEDCQEWDCTMCGERVEHEYDYDY